MTNSITINKCDNELILIAYQWGASFQIARILSGNNNNVDVQIDIQPGQFIEGVYIDGVNNGIENSRNFVNLQPGEYQLVAVGIDWGGPAEFNYTFNGEPQNFPLTGEGDGVVWNPAPITFTVPEPTH